MYNGSHVNNMYHDNAADYIDLQNVTTRATGGHESCYYDITILNHGNGSGIGSGSMYFKNIIYSGGAGAFCQVTGCGFNDDINNNEHDGFEIYTGGGNPFYGTAIVYGIK
jgi:hypothetical protein